MKIETLENFALESPFSGDSQFENYQSIFDLMPCIVSVQDRNFRLIKANKSFEKEFGKRIGELCYEVYKGRNEVCPNCSVEKTFRDGKVHHSEERVIKQNGREATILVTTSPIFDRENRVIAAIEMSLDITELRMLQDQLKTSEERYRILFNHQPNPIFVVTVDELFILDANQTAIIEYGYTMEEFVIKGFLGLFPNEERELIKRSFIERKKQILNVHQKKKDGTLLLTNILIAYWEYSAQKLAIVTVINITEQRKAEEQLAQASKLATLGQISAGVAHELNQPLSVIKSASTFLSFLSKKVIEKAIQENIESPPVVKIEAHLLKSLSEEIDSHINRATQIIQHLREFGRKSDLTVGEVNINECIEGALMVLGRQLQARGIKIYLHLDKDPPPVMGDKSRIEQVFINLILNARDAMEERIEESKGEPDEMVLIIRSFVDGAMVKVSFQDTGCGIPTHIMPRIFDPFFTTKEVGKGTGLGLSISYGIVRDYGGTIDVESKRGEGSIFTVSFPSAGKDN